MERCHNTTKDDFGQRHWATLGEDRQAPRRHEPSHHRPAHDSADYGLTSVDIRAASPSRPHGEIYQPQRRLQSPWGDRAWGEHDLPRYHTSQASFTRDAVPSSSPFERWARVYSEPRDLSHLKESPIAGVEVKRSSSDVTSSHSMIDASSVPVSNTHLDSKSPPEAAEVIKAEPDQTVKRVKESRYLRELDRREILARLAKGEKQSVLAKEYQVSRSTICNLLKQRDVVLARKNENPLSRHPKKTRLHSSRQSGQATGAAPSIKKEVEETLTTPTTSPRGSDDDLDPARSWSQYSAPFKPMLIRVESRAISLLQTYLYNRDTSSADFRRYCARLLRLLLEESLAAVAESRQISASLTAYIHGSLPFSKRPLCAISMEQRSTPMLDSFSLLEPHSRCGAVRYDGMGLVLRGPNLPEDFRGYEIFLLDIVSDSVRSIASAVSTLLERGAQEASLTVVTLAISSEAMEALHNSFPRVRIATAGVNPSPTDDRYGRAPPPVNFFHQRVLAAYS